MTALAHIYTAHPSWTIRQRDDNTWEAERRQGTALHLIHAPTAHELAYRLDDEDRAGG